MKPTRIVPFLLVGAVFIFIGVLVGATARVFPVQASAEAVAVDSLFNFMLAIAVVVFLIVEGGVIYTILRFRRKAGDESDGAPVHGNTALEITWTAIPAVIVFVLAIYSYDVFWRTHTPGQNALSVNATGAQFQWRFAYEMPADPNADAELRERARQYMVDSTLVLPVNRAIAVNINAEDVLHAFYIPEFRIKQDAIPGRTTQAYFTTIQKGEWWVICAELCGAGHGQMSQTNRIRVVEQAEYDQFVADLYGRAKAIASDPTRPEVGRILIVQRYACGACHILDDVGLRGNIGPSLNGIATRAEGHAAANEGLIGGTDAAAYIRGSILAPNLYLVQGYNAGVMPQNYSDPAVMPKEDLEAIVNYLLTQK